MGLWVTIYRRLGNGVKLASDDLTKAYLVACQGLIAFAAVAAFFGHALAAPSTGIPTLALVGCGLSYQRRLTTENLAAKTAEAVVVDAAPGALDAGSAYA
ncbi:MAG: hypothetical protein JSW46_01800 [Gemmatimonadota bacterium]|nr:MAG: hypothetical protein JSW46_01800 [Gemmatimonadota bacterium]